MQTSSNVRPAAAPPAAPAMAARAAAAPVAVTTPRAAVTATMGTATLRYIASAPIQVIGPVTRAIYRFSREAPLQRIARADAEPLLASGHFRLEF